MAQIMKGNKKNRRLSINLSLFALTDQNNSQKSATFRSPKHFEEPNGVVGLGIVPLLKSSGTSRAVILAISPRSPTPHSIPINIFKNNDMNKKKENNTTTPSVEEMEMCEEYTCVISHMGSNQIKKIEYFNGEFLGNTCTSTTRANTDSGMRETAAFKAADFLSSCFLCKKLLHGLDIFMYRGETAFCSVECRCKQISMDEHKESCGRPGAMKTHEHEYSASPMKFLAGVAVA
nr:uncharacterized protein LOC109146813 [Ipomoea trifida]GMC61308.1 FCS-Like Zinc finger 10-like [Ipomoea batatas]GMC71140.1 FCS-Like Zinc finger 10-like [Ipomoea batatas]GMD25759.1 FCS-Like Zinc finger 10-like [Ipomoea batatas]